MAEIPRGVGGWFTILPLSPRVRFGESNANGAHKVPLMGSFVRGWIRFFRRVSFLTVTLVTSACSSGIHACKLNFADSCLPHDRSAKKHPALQKIWSKTKWWPLFNRDQSVCDVLQLTHNHRVGNWALSTPQFLFG